MWQRLRRVSLTKWIFVGMGLGALLGVLFPGSGTETPGFDAGDLKLLSDLFVRMIKMIIAPILFATLVVGIAGHGDDLKRVGRLAFRSIVYFEVVTTIALLIGLVAVNLVRPGDDPALTAALAASSGPPRRRRSRSTSATSSRRASSTRSPRTTCSRSSSSRSSSPSR
jgi:proton glutamate symport protein